MKNFNFTFTTVIFRFLIRKTTKPTNPESTQISDTSQAVLVSTPKPGPSLMSVPELGPSAILTPESGPSMILTPDPGSEISEDDHDKDMPAKRKRKMYNINPTKIHLAFPFVDKRKPFLFCTICNMKLTGGRYHLKRHSNNSIHKKNEHLARTSIKMDRFVQSKDSSKQQLVFEAQLQMCAFICEKNLPLNIINSLPLLNKNIYPDSDIANIGVMKRKKATKLITKVLGPAFKRQIYEDLRSCKFSLIIDETTDISTKKSLVLVVRYYKNFILRDRFLDLLEVVKCTAEILFNTIRDYFMSNNIPLTNLIGFAADNASTMMGQLNGVQARFQEIVPNIYVLGCSCHSMHLCTSAAAKLLPNSVEQFTRDIYSYFAHSNKRMEELKECQIFLNENPTKMLYPSQTRWLSLLAVVDRILSHWDSLILFFKKASNEDNLPQAKSILNALNNPIFKLYLLFLSYVLTLTNQLNLEFQSEGSKFPIILNRLMALYKTILKNFIKKDVTDRIQLLEINIHNPGNYLAIENLYFGAKANAYVSNENINISKEDLHNFRLNIIKFYIEILSQIKKRFNFNDKHLKFAANFVPEKVLSGNIRSIGDFLNLFPNIEVDIQKVDMEWQLLCETDLGFKEESCPLNEFWEKVCKTKNSLGEYIFSNLTVVVSTVLALPHSSAAAERAFSQLALTKTALRNKLSIATCSAILSCKDEMRQYKQGSLEWRPNFEKIKMSVDFAAAADDSSESD